MKKPYSLNEVKDLANGRWREILPSLGVPIEILNSQKHFPCPACGGKDRFRFTDNKGRGWFICNHCTPDGGSGLDLLMLVHGYGFSQAVTDVAGFLGLDNRVERPTVAMPIPTTPQIPVHASNQLERIQAMIQGACAWNESDSWIQSYLVERGFPLKVVEKLPISKALQFSKGLNYYSLTEKRSLGRFPAMVGVFRRLNGELAGVHLTYLMKKDNKVMKLSIKDPKNGTALPAKKMRSVESGSLNGSAIRLFMPDKRVLAVSEGIETALAVHCLSGLPVWACGSANGLRSFELPSGIERLVIIADNDVNQTGIQSALTLKRRYFKQLKGNIQLWQPDELGQDALDVLRHALVSGYKVNI